MITVFGARLGAHLVTPGLALAAALALGTPAVAAPPQAAAPPVAQPLAPAAPPATAELSESEQLSRHMVGVALSNIDSLKPLVNAAILDATKSMKGRLGKKDGLENALMERMYSWYPLMGDAMWEEIADDRPVYEEMIGHFMATHFTVDELRAAAELVDSPAATEFRTLTMLQMAHKDRGAVLGPKAKLAIERFKNSPGGQSFLAKAKTIEKDPAFQPLAVDLIALWLPGTMRRWGEKTEALEKARRATLTR